MAFHLQLQRLIGDDAPFRADAVAPEALRREKLLQLLLQAPD